MNKTIHEKARLAQFWSVSEVLVLALSNTSRLAIVKALSAIGMRTSFGDICEIGPKSIFLGFIMDTLVVFVAMGVIIGTGRF